MPTSAKWDIRGLFAGLSEDSELRGASNGFGPVGDIEFVVDTSRMGFDNTRCHNEMPGDLLVGFAQCNEMEYFQLAPCDRLDQPGGMRNRSTSLDPQFTTENPLEHTGEIYGLFFK